MKVERAMHKKVKCVEPKTPVREIARRMRVADVGAIPVQHNSTLVGIITDRDIACRAVANGADLDALHARDIMTTDVATCSAEDDIKSALSVTERNQVRRLPVVDHANGVIGMLSLGDISHKVSHDISGSLLQSVSAHHA